LGALEIDVTIYENFRERNNIYILCGFVMKEVKYSSSEIFREPQMAQRVLLPKG
jgi:hypothetical protein